MLVLVLTVSFPLHILVVQHDMTRCLCLSKQTGHAGSLFHFVKVAPGVQKGGFLDSGDVDHLQKWFFFLKGDLDCDLLCLEEPAP